LDQSIGIYLGQSISIDVQSIGIDEVGVAILFSGQSIGIDDDQSIGIDEAWAWQTFSGHRLRRFLERSIGIDENKTFPFTFLSST